ncbi:ATP-binding protein [Actinoplanes derwentensis]|uniref:Histidine kinase/HSP90-like ATPase domain-containing protein n=1 Tax=Actinoplanes derwentensis TaxID=113562 RepID=A0A1H1VL27_9ACTN|nr:ATP-binding protein [Actinoplanes derwentensis]GID83660.1 hypothetical protein Ade03nite_25840 [Actinoplanes derwentensis]SDS85618.1 hypothetical protein SAMN04489716_1804 [Actinoplanes derwentensis]
MIILSALFERDDPAAPLRHRVQTVLSVGSGAAVGAEWIGDVLIAVSELVQNVGQHTGGGGELTLSATADGLLIEVADSMIAAPRLRQPDHRQVGGRGLLLIDSISLGWGTRHHEHGKTVWALMPAPALVGSGH